MHNEIFSNGVLGDFSARILQASTSVELKALLGDVVVALGYGFFGYHVVKHTVLHDGGSDRQPLGIFNLPDEWAADYISKNHVDDDKVVELALAGKPPFHWRSELLRCSMTQKQRLILKKAEDAGLVDGYTLPLVSRDGEIAILTVFPDEETKSVAQQKYNENLLYVLAQFFHIRALRVVMEERFVSTLGRRRSFLSGRERETALWISRGKSSWEIAQILGISEKSVEFYADSVKRKLNAVNRTQAVVKALFLGLIDDADEKPSSPRQVRPPNRIAQLTTVASS
jgi:DNA-binding CsgD family transcriptional regulator